MEILVLLLLLGSDSAEARDLAAERLHRIGRPAWPLLEKALESRDLEVRMRARTVLLRQALPDSMLDRQPDLLHAARVREVRLLIMESNPAKLSRISNLRTWSLDPLVDAVGNPRFSPRCRQFALQALALIRDKRAILPILRITGAAGKVKIAES